MVPYIHTYYTPICSAIPLLLIPAFSKCLKFKSGAFKKPRNLSLQAQTLQYIFERSCCRRIRLSITCVPWYGMNCHLPKQPYRSKCQRQALAPTLSLVCIANSCSLAIVSAEATCRWNMVKHQTTPRMQEENHVQNHEFLVCMFFQGCLWAGWPAQHGGETFVFDFIYTL